jgi:predicted O-methyltransferase YrrM
MTQAPRTTLPFLATVICRQIAEIGVGTGETSLKLARYLAGQGTLHLFDRQDTVAAVADQIRRSGFDNVRSYGCSNRCLDSYNWPLGKLIDEHSEPLFDYVFLDGAHTWAHDALAFFLIDRLLIPGGYLDVDDYLWTIAASPTSSPDREPALRALYTDEQMSAQQIKMVVDRLIRRTPGYVEIVEGRIFRKVSHQSSGRTRG